MFTFVCVIKPMKTEKNGRIVYISTAKKSILMPAKNSEVMKKISEFLENELIMEGGE